MSRPTAGDEEGPQNRRFACRLPKTVYLLPKGATPMDNDYWRPVAGYPNYQVSRGGEVRSIKRGKLLAQARGRRGYAVVNLYRWGQAKCFLVHRLVAAAFLGIIPPGWQINHLNGDKECNEVGNLEIVTAEENRQHAVRQGLVLRGEANPRAKLTEADVRDIRRQRAEGVRVRDIARYYDLSERAVYLICRRLSWKHVA